MTGRKLDLRAITEGEDAADVSGIAHAAALVAFAAALVGDDDVALAVARKRVRDEVGPEGLVDAASVASNFERMVRVADSTGIPLDGVMATLSEDIRQDLDLGRFGSSANTPVASSTQRALGALARPAVHGLMRAIALFRRA